MDNGHVNSGPGINVRFAKVIQREEAKAAASREGKQARKAQSTPSGTVVDGTFACTACGRIG